MEKIKLVIWDLDETFWQGTLSEGGVETNAENVLMVKELAHRGIMSSISSKNDFDAAKKKLEEIGVWEYFIFPSINWNPKGESVKRLIEQCQLRSPNVLFIDDNISNRKEVEHYNPGINTLSETEIPKLLEMPELKGKDDSELSRLKQYKVLEKKAMVKETYSDNHTFLLESDIRINFITDVKRHRDRIIELINRTNQLNYTKIRLEESEVDSMLSNLDYENVCIHVIDKFGDYGICGFYSLNKNTHHLNHFLFSCRILNLGIETYVFNVLGKPTINVKEPVAGKLNSEEQIDWIREEKETTAVKEKSKRKKIRALLLGGCDLEQMCHYIDSNRLEIIKEFNYPNKLGNAVHREHTQFLKIAVECNDSEKKEVGRLPFCDERMFDTHLTSGDYDVLVYSVLMNYTQNVFRNRAKGYRIAYGGYSKGQSAFNALPLNVEERNIFEQDFEYEGQQSPERFLEDLAWLYSTVKGKPIIFINGSEIMDFNDRELGACERHHAMNIVLDDFISHHDNCQLLDIRKFVSSRADCTNNLRHYQRPIYVKMANYLMIQIVGKERLSYKIKRIVSRLYGRISQYRFMRRIIRLCRSCFAYF